MSVNVFTPADGNTVPELQNLRQGAALVGVTRAGEVELAICEHARGQGHKDIFADRAREAAQALLGRSRDITVVRVPADAVTPVGYWDDAQGVIRLVPGRQSDVARWLGHAAYRNDLEASDSAHNVQQDARQRARRAFIQGRPDQGMRIMSQHGLRHW
jgi:hypothetical protein